MRLEECVGEVAQTPKRNRIGHPVAGSSSMAGSGDSGKVPTLSSAHLVSAQIIFEARSLHVQGGRIKFNCPYSLLCQRSPF